MLDIGVQRMYAAHLNFGVVTSCKNQYNVQTFLENSLVREF